MKNITINIENYRENLLKKYAQGNRITTAEYVTNIINTWIDSHIEGSFNNKLKGKTYNEKKLFLGEPEP